MANWANDLLVGMQAGSTLAKHFQTNRRQRGEDAWLSQQAQRLDAQRTADEQQFQEAQGLLRRQGLPVGGETPTAPASSSAASTQPTATSSPAAPGVWQTVQQALGLGPVAPQMPAWAAREALFPRRDSDWLSSLLGTAAPTVAAPAATAGEPAADTATDATEGLVPMAYRARSSLPAAALIRTAGITGGRGGALSGAAAAGGEPAARVDPRVLYQGLLDRGVSPVHAVGVVTNIAAESGYNPATIHDQGTGYGLFGHRLDRRDQLFAHAGTEAPSWQQQLDYALSEPEMRAYLAQDFGQDVGAAASAFVKGFERPKDMRGEQARRALAALNYRHYLPTAVPTASQQYRA